METQKITQTVLQNCYKNAQMALVSLDDVIPKAQGGLKEELLAERDGYEKLITEATALAHEKNIELTDVGTMKKSMVAASIKMKTMVDDSDSHIAEMTMKGTVMGVTELIRDISESGALIDKEVLELLKKFRVFEENCEEKLKDYI